MAGEQDSERRRKLAELARWHDEWTARHDPDEPAGAEHPHDVDSEALAAAEREYMTRAREIMGLDPETGRRAR
jgi:hypothetical protein